MYRDIIMYAKVIVLQEPGAAVQPPRWRQCERFLFGYSAGGAGSSPGTEGEYMYNVLVRKKQALSCCLKTIKVKRE